MVRYAVGLLTDAVAWRRSGAGPDAAVLQKRMHGFHGLLLMVMRVQLRHPHPCFLKAFAQQKKRGSIHAPRCVSLLAAVCLTFDFGLLAGPCWPRTPLPHRTIPLPYRTALFVYLARSGMLLGGAVADRTHEAPTSLQLGRARAPCCA